MDTIFFDFLARRNSISVSRKRIFQRMPYFFQRLLLEEAFFLSSGKLFFNESFIPAIGEGFYSLMETINLLEKFFLRAESVTAMSGNQFLKTELILADFVDGGNHFLLLSHTFFKEHFIPISGNAFVSPKE